MRTPSFTRRLAAVLVCLASLPPLLAQVCLNEDEPIAPPQLLGGGGNLYETRHGQYLPTRGTLRVLVVLVEVDYQTPGEPDPTGTNGYPGMASPPIACWVNNHQKNFAPQASTRQPTAPKAV